MAQLIFPVPPQRFALGDHLLDGSQSAQEMLDDGIRGGMYEPIGVKREYAGKTTVRRVPHGYYEEVPGGYFLEAQFVVETDS